MDEDAMTAQVMHMPSSDASDSHATARANGMNPKLMAKMVNRPTLLQQEKEKALNKQIEKVFELDSF